MKTKILTNSALLVSLSMVLSAIPIIRLPNDGKVTLASMVPVILISLIYGSRQGIISAFIYSVLQMVVCGIAPPPTRSLFSYFLVVFLDYILSFTVLGAAGVFFKKFKNLRLGIVVSGTLVIILRFICHFVSGILIWSVYAPSEISPILYSLLYNGSYIGIELIITIIILLFLSRFKRIFYK